MSHDARTPRRDVIVIGGSAGAFEVLLKLLSQLPVDLGASVVITLHRHPTFASSLADVLGLRSTLEVLEPKDRQRLNHNRVYLAPADQHLVIDGDLLRLNRDPRRHHTRPAIDPLFISAAESCGSRVIGLLLTGNLSDGVSGLIRIKEMGGLSVIQDPSEAAYPSMPCNALVYDHVDLVVRTASMASILARLVQGSSVPALANEPGSRHP